MYNHAFIIGKFIPFHIGHKEMITWATSKANTVHVCITGCPEEPFTVQQRVKWLSEEFKDNHNIDIIGLEFDSTKLSKQSESDMLVAQDWSNWLSEKISDVWNNIDVFIGSEEYIKYLANINNVDYIIYDQQRNNINISATEIRNDVIKNWEYLCPSVKRDYVTHICLCGGQSSGKTTLTRRLEDKYSEVTGIYEIGRFLCGSCDYIPFSRLEKIYNIHREILEEIKYNPPTPFVIWDTDNLTTIAYMSMIYPDNIITKSLLSDISVPLADSYIFLKNTTFINDGSRFNNGENDTLIKSLKDVYKSHNCALRIETPISAEFLIGQYIKERTDKIKHDFIYDKDDLSVNSKNYKNY